MAYPNEVYKVALSFVKRLNVDIVRRMSELGMSAMDFFLLETPVLSEMLGLARGITFEKMDRDEALFRGAKEWEDMQRHHITGYSILDPDYPVRLLQIHDAPIYLYKLGEADLDARHIINLVGTRKPTPYGVDFCGKLVTDLGAYFSDLIVVSGLAYGIDATAHKAALDNGLTTVAVVAHGLNMIYPASHRDLAKTIIRNGGAIVSEYPFGTQPYRQHFLERNRIVAALSDVTIVVESAIKGGAMSTANTAFSYSRDVMAVPGRVSDILSAGCNHLIRKEKAHLLTAAADIIELTGWKPLDVKIDTLKRNLFPELDGETKLVYDTLRFSQDPLQVDRIHALTLIPIARLMTTLGEMEFDGIVIRHPGNRFSIA